MERLAIQQLINWKNNPSKKPLIIQGARQVGKTWLMKDFAKSHFKKHVYINFENSSRLQNIFENDFNIPRIISILEIETGETIDSETLILFDEIQEANKGLTALKYFCEDAPEFPIIAAGSLLGVSIQKNNSFPVGKVDFLTLYPLTFEEFLINNNERKILHYLKEKNWDIIKPFHEKLVSLLRTYYFTGGMPEVLKTYLETKNFKQVRTIQNNIISGYENDFAKYAPIEIVPKIRLVWHSILSQLSKENKKFIYGQLKKGARAKEFENSINWLENAGLIFKSFRVTKPTLPLKAYTEIDAFKLYLIDIGLLNAMGDLDEKLLLEKNNILTEFKGASTEQFVCMQLKTKHDLFYWSADNALSELDVLITKDNMIIPIEIKAEENLKAKSLKVYIEKFKPQIALRSSMSFYREEEQFINLPLYAVGML